LLIEPNGAARITRPGRFQNATPAGDKTGNEGRHVFIISPQRRQPAVPARPRRAEIEGTLNLIGGITIIILVLMAVWNVVGRKLSQRARARLCRLDEQFMILFAFFGLAYCQREGGHIRMDIVVMRLQAAGCSGPSNGCRSSS
jgi:hypothetical protein